MEHSQLRLLIDTNVWIDNYIPYRPGSEVSCELIKQCAHQDVATLYPLRALADVYWQVLRDRKEWFRNQYGSLNEAQAHVANEDAWICVDNMMELGAPVGADVSDVWIAQHLRDIHNDFEDNMVLAAAERAKADYLVTSDLKLIQKATVAALTPHDMLVLLKMRQEEA